MTTQVFFGLLVWGCVTLLICWVWAADVKPTRGPRALALLLAVLWPCWFALALVAALVGPLLESVADWMERKP
jgi:hypothetical protein